YTQSGQQSAHGAQHHNTGALPEEHRPYAPYGKTQGTQHHGVFAFFYHQHGKRPDDVKGSNEENKGQYNEDGQFFTFHYAQGHGMLMQAVLYFEPGWQQGLYRFYSVGFGGTGL